MVASAFDVKSHALQKTAPAKGGKTHVIKVGTSTILTNDETGGQKANLSNLARLVEVIATLRNSGDHVILVSSGAVGMGCLKLGLQERPTGCGAKQAMAAAGQSRLMRLYEDLFQVVNVQVAQLLITREDFSDKLRFLSVRNTLFELMRLGVVPIINENDSLHAGHITNFGDNDTMAAMTAALVEADWLFLATDVTFLYTANPKTDPDAKPIHVVDDIAKLCIGGLESSSSQWGTGGMATKLIAASIAVCAGCHCGLVNGAEPERVVQLIRGQREGGTQFTARTSPDVVNEGMHSRWILALPLGGSLVIDAKGYKSVLKGRNLPAHSVLKVSGSFEIDQAVSLVYNGQQIARALVRSTSTALSRAVLARTQPPDGLGLRDFTYELEAAGVYLKDYRSWRAGSHKGAKGEMDGKKLHELQKTKPSHEVHAETASKEPALAEAAQPPVDVAAFASDIVITAVGTIKEAEEVLRRANSPTRKRMRSASPLSESRPMKKASGQPV